MKALRSLQKRFVEVGCLLALVNLMSVAASPHAGAGESRGPARVVALGDSLTAGFDLAPSEAFPAQLERALRARGHAVEIANAGVSGDTTAAGLARFDWAVPEGTEAVILVLGGNDALRGIDPKATRANLDRMLAQFAKRNIVVLLAGMKAPRNWGEPYVSDFDAIYPELAKKYDSAVYYPFFLDGVALDSKLNLKDGIHPNARGIAEIVNRMLPSAEKLVARVAEARKAVGPRS